MLLFLIRIFFLYLSQICFSLLIFFYDFKQKILPLEEGRLGLRAHKKKSIITVSTSMLLFRNSDELLHLPGIRRISVFFDVFLNLRKWITSKEKVTNYLNRTVSDICGIKNNFIYFLISHEKKTRNKAKHRPNPSIDWFNEYDI